MNLPEFIKAVDKLVSKWAVTRPQQELEMIYNEVCEQAVHRLAVAVTERQRGDVKR